MLDPAWAVSFLEADDWTYSVTGGELVVDGIHSTIPCNRYGGSWSLARITRTFAAIDHFRLMVKGSWTSGGPAAIQRMDVFVGGANLWIAVDDCSATRIF